MNTRASYAPWPARLRPRPHRPCPLFLVSRYFCDQSGQLKVDDRVADVDIRQHTVIVEAVEDQPAGRRSPRCVHEPTWRLQHDRFAEHREHGDFSVVAL